MISGNLTEVLKALNKAKEKQIVQGKSIDFNRKILEHKKTYALILNHKAEKDSLYERNSGLNHILCDIAKKNNITFILDLREISGNNKQKAEIIGRIIQNIKLIKKSKNKLKIIGMNKHEAASVLLVLGLPTDMVKTAV